MPSRRLRERIHNPRNLECRCDPDCWCKRTSLGRALRWWFPARWLGLRHKEDFFKGLTRDEIREWRRQQEARGIYWA
jgi:hypothetical protein